MAADNLMPHISEAELSAFEAEAEPEAPDVQAEPKALVDKEKFSILGLIRDAQELDPQCRRISGLSRGRYIRQGFCTHRDFRLSAAGRAE